MRVCFLIIDFEISFNLVRVQLWIEFDWKFSIYRLWFKIQFGSKWKFPIEIESFIDSILNFKKIIIISKMNIVEEALKITQKLLNVDNISPNNTEFKGRFFKFTVCVIKTWLIRLYILFINWICFERLNA